MDTPKHNSIVYARHGAQARYVSNTPEGHLVIPIIEVMYGDSVEDQDGDPAIWNEVFIKPPTEKLNEEVAKLSAQLDILRGQVRDAQTKWREDDNEIVARKKRITQHEQLKYLDDYLTKGVTHYVEERYDGITIITFDSTKSDYNYRCFKLLTLWGDSKGNLAWDLESQHTSPHRCQVWPCCCLEEAKAKQLERYEVMWTKWREGKKPDYFIYYVNTAVALGIKLPDDVAIELKADKIRSAQSSVDHCMKQLEEAKVKLSQTQVS